VDAVGEALEFRATGMSSVVMIGLTACAEVLAVAEAFEAALCFVSRIAVFEADPDSPSTHPQAVREKTNPKAERFSIEKLLRSALQRKFSETLMQLAIGNLYLSSWLGPLL
jgi:hypothetical protein